MIIKESDNQIIKEEILECADGRSRVDAPTYWLTIRKSFIMVDIYTPKYCPKYYSKININ